MVKRLWNRFTLWTNNQTLNVQKWIWSVVVVAILSSACGVLLAIMGIGVWCAKHAPWLLPVYFFTGIVCIIRICMSGVNPDTP